MPPYVAFSSLLVVHSSQHPGFRASLRTAVDPNSVPLTQALKLLKGSDIGTIMEIRRLREGAEVGLRDGDPPNAYVDERLAAREQVRSE